MIGPFRILLGDFGYGWLQVLNVGMIVLLSVAGMAAAFTRDLPVARFLVLCGAIIMGCFDLPLYFVDRQSFLPWHFLAVGHVFILTGSVRALQGWVRGSAVRPVVSPTSRRIRSALLSIPWLVMLVVLALTVRQLSREWEPRSTIVLCTDKQVLEWLEWTAAVPVETMHVVRAKRDAIEGIDAATCARMYTYEGTATLHERYLPIPVRFW